MGGGHDGDAGKTGMNDPDLWNFVKESNHIEGIDRQPLDEEIEAHEKFLGCPIITLHILYGFVQTVQPEAVLRDAVGLDVRVGSHIPPAGGPEIKDALENILDLVESGDPSPYDIHNRYESLHPFTDGNGRSGCALWLWMMVNSFGKFPKLGFLHTWYYQSLNATQSGRIG